ncbi:hypothetical protein MP228_012707 [Amoeboaphelidium protococcarum]|nr:hypothetical protein MP228_012707 [Amoeboaphelidium protococcarum]
MTIETDVKAQGPSQKDMNGINTPADKQDDKEHSSLTDFGNLFRTQPCARPALLTGIGTGLSLGAIRYHLSLNVLSATNYAYGSFLITSFIYWHVCQYRRIEMAKRGNVIKAPIKVKSIRDLEDRYQEFIEQKGLDQEEVFNEELKSDPSLNSK